MKLLGIDFGDERIGLALGESGSIAVPHSIVSNNDMFWAYIAQLVNDESIKRIIVGWPLSMSGEENQRTEKTKEFIEMLEKHVSVPVEKEDERLSSKSALSQGATGRVDASAAAVILQSYLDRDASP